jgi:cytochrome c553
VRKRYSLIILVAAALLPFTPGKGATQEKSSTKPPAQPAAEAGSPPSIQQVYNTDVRPILQKYCARCHGDDKAKADVRLDKLSIDFVKGPEGDQPTAALLSVSQVSCPAGRRC